MCFHYLEDFQQIWSWLWVRIVSTRCVEKNFTLQERLNRFNWPVTKKKKPYLNDESLLVFSPFGVDFEDFKLIESSICIALQQFSNACSMFLRFHKKKKKEISLTYPPFHLKLGKLHGNWMDQAPFRIFKKGFERKNQLFLIITFCLLDFELKYDEHHKTTPLIEAQAGQRWIFQTGSLCNHMGHLWLLHSCCFLLGEVCFLANFRNLLKHRKYVLNRNK